MTANTSTSYLSLPPLKSNVVDDKQILTNPWMGWCRNIAGQLGYDNNHNGTWTPVFTNLAIAGTVNITAKYYKIKRICIFNIVLTPVGGGSGTQSNANNVLNNLPFSSISYEIPQIIDCTAKNLKNTAFLDNGTSNIYLPTWAPTGNVIAISGIYQVDDSIK